MQEPPGRALGGSTTLSGILIPQRPGAPVSPNGQLPSEILMGNLSETLPPATARAGTPSPPSSHDCKYKAPMGVGA